MCLDIKAYGLVESPVPILKAIAERAYYKWLNGSTDEYKNWCDAVKEELFKFRKLNS